MPQNTALFPLTQTLVAQATITTNTTSAAFTLPSCNSYRFVVEVATVSGTSPTLQVILATSTDSTSYHEIISFSQCTTSGLGRQTVFQPYVTLGNSQTTTTASNPKEVPVGLLGTTDLGSSAIVLDGPINPQFMKARFVVGGTSPSFAVALKMYAVPSGWSDSL